MRSLLGLFAAIAITGALVGASASPVAAQTPAGGALSLAAVQAEADQGDAEAIATLGWMYETGRGVAADPARARGLYRTAMRQGDRFGAWRLGVMIDKGLAPGGSAQALALFRQAAAQKSPGAMASLGVMYANGRGVERDFEAAMRYYQAAARMGSAHGLEGIGVLYANGQGVARDMAEALAHWLVAAAAGDAGAMALLTRHMPPASAPEAAPIYDRANAIADAYGILEDADGAGQARSGL